VGYINSAQPIVVEVYRLGAWFPVVFGAAAMAMAVASFVNSRLVMSLGMRRIGHAALLGYVAVSAVMIGLVLLMGALPLAVFLGLFALDLFCFGLVMPNFNAIAMEPMGRIAGTAWSFIGAVTTVISACSASLWVSSSTARSGRWLPAWRSRSADAGDRAGHRARAHVPPTRLTRVMRLLTLVPPLRKSRAGRSSSAG
jgi:hypothetical protein